MGLLYDGAWGLGIIHLRLENDFSAVVFLASVPFWAVYGSMSLSSKINSLNEIYPYFIQA